MRNLVFASAIGVGIAAVACACLVVVAAVVILVLNAPEDEAQDTVAQEVTPSPSATRPQPTLLPVDSATCENVVRRAYDLTMQVCDATRRDEACYGNTRILAQPETAAFREIGDIAPLAEIDSLRLSSLNTQSQEWGISLMRIQANLPDEQPDQAVELLLFGNVQITDTAEQHGSQFGVMQAFTFTSGMDDRPCTQAPDSGIMIQTPQGVGEISLLVNEVVVDLGSTVFLQAQPSRELIVNVVEGHADVTSFGQTVSVPAGARSRVPLNNLGLAANVPSPPEPYSITSLQTLPIMLLDRPFAIAPSLTMAVTPSPVGVAALPPTQTPLVFNTVTPAQEVAAAPTSTVTLAPTLTSAPLIPSDTPTQEGVIVTEEVIPSFTHPQVDAPIDQTIIQGQLGQLVDVTYEGKVFASTVYDGYPEYLAVDGDATTSWFSTGPERLPTQYRWTGYQDDVIASISILSNAKNANPDFQTNFGFGAVTVQVLDANETVVYDMKVDLSGTPDPDVYLEPNVTGRSVVLWFSGHEDPTCGGFSELQIIAMRYSQ